MSETSQPNIVIIYADDLGFGDVGCYGAKTIPTPNIDRLARDGLLFDNGYATAATCTPSRYSLLAGTYPWRNPKAAILPGDAPLIIGTEEATLPKKLREQGYRTGIVGKWHLGLGDGTIDWNGDIARTPNDVGFDDSFIMAATNDRVPCVFVRNRNVVNLDANDPIEVSYDPTHRFPGEKTGHDNPELLSMMYSHGHDGTIINGVSRIGHMRGGTAAIWNDETMGAVFASEAASFIRENRNRPFFLYYALHQPHVPRIPNPAFKGATPHGPRGDVIAELDWCLGKVLDTLDAEGLRENTIVVFSSDNGPVLDDGYEDRAEQYNENHRAAGPLRGGKYSRFDGGTRVPFIVSRPGTITPGTSHAIVSQADFLATFTNLAGGTLHDGEAPDSLDIADALFGRSDAGREEMLVEGLQAQLVLRRGSWTYIPPSDRPAVNAHTNTELGNSPKPQLYDLSADIGQIRNVADENPDRTREMDEALTRLMTSPQTRP